MAEVFIVRPFGSRRPVLKKNTKNGLQTIYFDFDRVETDLIKPAMRALNLGGGTTGEVFASGSIHEDMFSELLLADIVIADITIHNANVFYELGIRHALRDKSTILIKASGYDETPFDIIGYKYHSYNEQDPAASLDAFIKMMHETLELERTDSPVFKVLPHLDTHDPEKYIAMPQDFVEEVRVAAEAGYAGRLGLLAYEAQAFNWRLPAYRLIGEHLFRLKKYGLSKEVWDKIIAKKKKDIQANDRLSTIYQRLAEAALGANPQETRALLAQSDMAAEIIIKDKNIDNYTRAEAYTLLARNEKTRWVMEWSAAVDKQKKALESIFLQQAQEYYERGFLQNLNHYYSGLNALALLKVQIALAENNTTTWELKFDTEDDALRELEKMKKRQQSLTASLRLSLDAAKAQLKAKNEKDPWLDISEADYLFLTSNRSEKVAAVYAAVLNNVNPQGRESALKQIKIYAALQLFNEHTTATLSTVLSPAIDEPLREHFLLFTGHMIDKPDREKPRFPVTKAKENAVKRAIKKAVMDEQKRLPDGYILKGIAGGACGGDILFHEVCQEAGIESAMFLALPPDQFKKESVAHAGIGWVDRFNQLYKKLPHPVLSASKELPGWLRGQKNYGIWDRNNLWELHFALVNGGSNMTLIALWDKQKADGPGGTEDMVNKVNERGGKVVVVDIRKL
jgi:hypothetical protein